MLSHQTSIAAIVFLFPLLLSCSESSTTGELVVNDVPETYPSDNDERAKARHILIAYQEAFNAAPDVRRSKDDAHQQADEILEKVTRGLDFTALSRAHSDDPTDHRSGELGVISRGQMVPEFEEALFALNIHEFHLVETLFGFHVLQRLPLDERELVHILLQWKDKEQESRSKEEAFRLAKKADSELQEGVSPTVVAQRYSDGPFGSRGGHLGWFEHKDLHPNIADEVFALESNSCSKITQTSLGYHIFCRLR